jgi:hypothetical protein
MLNIVILSVVGVRAVMLRIVILNDIKNEPHFAECCNTGSHYAVRRFSESFCLVLLCWSSC